jgi:hypothetical protein
VEVKPQSNINRLGGGSTNLVTIPPTDVVGFSAAQVFTPLNVLIRLQKIRLQKRLIDREKTAMMDQPDVGIWLRVALIFFQGYGLAGGHRCGVGYATSRRHCGTLKIVGRHHRTFTERLASQAHRLSKTV